MSIYLTVPNLLQPSVSIPGTVGALVVERPADPEEGYHLTAPLVYHFGHKSPSDNMELYTLLITRLAEVVNMRSDAKKRGTVVRASCSLPG